MSLFRRISNLFFRSSMEQEIDAELKSHVEMRTADNIARGMSPEAALRDALLKFGNPIVMKEKVTKADAALGLESFFRDVRYALRQLRKSPGFAVTAILTLALGIGATAAMFSIVNTVLLNPLPFPHSDRLMWLKQQDHSLPGITPESLSYPDYFAWRAQNHTFSGMASYRGGSTTLQVRGGAQRLESQTVSANFFQVLGTLPTLGRDFGWREENPGNRSVMLSYQLWQSAFGSATSIVGQSIRLDDHSYLVAGVMPKDFQFPIGKPAAVLWISLSNDADGEAPFVNEPGADVLRIIGRLKPGVTMQQAKADLDLIATHLARQYPDTNKWYTSCLIQPELDHMIGDTSTALRILFGAVTLLLLIACANVAGLLLARGSRRTAEFALRSAVGASRAVIIWQLLIESATLSLCASVVGVCLAVGLLKGMIRLVPLDIPRIEHASLNGTVLIFVLGVSIITGLLFGILPALRISRLEPSLALRGGARGITSGRGQHRLHNGLVISQLAVGLILLVTSGLFIRSFVHTLNVDPGFNPKHVLTARLGVSFDRYSHDQHFQVYQQIVTRLMALPGVQAVSAAYPLPLSGSRLEFSFAIQGRPVARGDWPSESIVIVMPGFFKTMRIPLMAGRAFTERDGTKGAPVMMINQAFARKYFARENPIGQHIQVGLGDGSFNKPVREVVGVVGDVKQKGLAAKSVPEYYLPFAQAVITNPVLTIRTSGDPASIGNEVQTAVNETYKNVPVYEVSTLKDYLSESLAQPRFQTLLLTFFAVVALILSAISLYGLLAYIVTQRTFEIGLRMALGAKRIDVLSMIIRQGLKLAVAGLLVGLGISLGITRLLSKMLYGIQPFDLPTFAVVTLVLLVVSLGAGAVPAIRAARLDPVTTLREQ